MCGSIFLTFSQEKLKKGIKNRKRIKREYSINNNSPSSEVAGEELHHGLNIYVTQLHRNDITINKVTDFCEWWLSKWPSYLFFSWSLFLGPVPSWRSFLGRMKKCFKSGWRSRHIPKEVTDAASLGSEQVCWYDSWGVCGNLLERNRDALAAPT